MGDGGGLSCGHATCVSCPGPTMRFVSRIHHRMCRCGAAGCSLCPGGVDWLVHRRALWLLLCGRRHVVSAAQLLPTPACTRGWATGHGLPDSSPSGACVACSPGALLFKAPPLAGSMWHMDAACSLLHLNKGGMRPALDGHLCRAGRVPTTAGAALGPVRQLPPENDAACAPAAETHDWLTAGSIPLLEGY